MAKRVTTMLACNRALRRCSSSQSNDWRLRTNYFKDHWNKEMFGPVKGKRKPGFVDASDEAEEPEVVEQDRFWAERARTLSVRLHDKSLQKQHDESCPLVKAISTAAGVRGLETVAGHRDKDSLLAGASAVLSEEVASTGVTGYEAAAPKRSDVKRRVEQVDAFHPRFSPMVNNSKPAFKLGQVMLGGAPLNFGRQSEHGCESSPGAGLPSVTRILKETMAPEDQLRLQKWEEGLVREIGRQAFNRMQETTLLRGERLHHILNMYFEHEDVGKMDIGDPVSRNHLRSIGPFLEKFSRPPLAVESSVVHPKLGYKGYTDCVTMVCDHDKPEKSVVALIDWKTSAKPKNSLGSTFDNPLQIAAYIGAFNHDDRYPIRVENGLIVVVYNDGNPATLLPITKKKLEKYWYAWLKRLRLHANMAQCA